MTSLWSLPWCSTSQGPPSCLQVMVFMGGKLRLLGHRRFLIPDRSPELGRRATPPPMPSMRSTPVSEAIEEEVGDALRHRGSLSAACLTRTPALGSAGLLRRPAYNRVR